MKSDRMFTAVLALLVSAVFIWPADSCASMGIIIGLLVLAHVVGSRSRLL